MMHRWLSRERMKGGREKAYAVVVWLCGRGACGGCERAACAVCISGLNWAPDLIDSSPTIGAHKGKRKGPARDPLCFFTSFSFPFPFFSLW